MTNSNEFLEHTEDSIPTNKETESTVETPPNFLEESITLDSLKGWMSFLSGQSKSYNDGDLSVYIYGELDESYIVVEKDISHSPRVSKQYVIHALNKKNHLYALICFLNECDFNISTMLSKIESADYIEKAMNDISTFEHVEIARYEIQEVKPNEK